MNCINIKNRLFGFVMTLCLLAAPALLYAQNRIVVKGVVTDDTNQPVIGASVMLKGSTIGVPTDIDGMYSIEVEPNAVLEFSSVGLRTEEVRVNGRTNINVVLTTDQTFLESVVVVGYGTQKKGSVTGSVAGIGADDIIKTKSENPQNMLTGRVPGLRVWQRSAEPGAYNANIDIRGMGGVLVIIDGVPRSQEDFQRLNPADIDNVSILKDAAAAIYGVRGGNGVLLVTTKKGSEGKASVHYNGSFTFQTPSKMPQLADAAGSIELYNEKAMNTVAGGSPVYSQDMLEEYRNGTRKAADWNSLVLSKMSPQTQHDLSISGGNEKYQYYASMGYIYQEGFFRSGDLNYSKYNLRANITAEIVDGLKFELNLAALQDQQNNPYSSSVDLIRNYWSKGVLYPAYADEDQTILNYEGLDLMENTVAMMTSSVSGYRKYNKKTFQSSATLSYDFGAATDVLKGLTLKGMFSYDFRYDNNEVFRKEYYLYKNNGDGTYTEKLFANSSPNRLSKSAFDRYQLLGQVMLSYDRTFAGKHKVGALVGWEAQQRVGNNFSAAGELMFSNPYFTSLMKDNQTVGIDAGLGAFYDLAYQAIIGRVNYGYDDRYLIEAQFRYDGSSKFAPGHQWGFFPSVSAGWRISEEPFFKDSALNFINQLKIRASYGIMGDDDGVNYEWMTGYTYLGGDENGNGYYTGYAPGYIFDGKFIYGVSPQPLPNVNISWYTAKTFNVGLDFEAWNGMLGLSADYFQRTRTGLFAQNTNSLPTVVGAAPAMENLESDRHFGLELELSHRNKVGDFAYQIKGMMTITRQKFLKSVRKGNYGSSYDQWRNDNLNNRYQGVQFGYEGVGRFESWEDIWNYDGYVENNTLPGDYIYLDWNGDGEINGLDEHPYAFDQTPWMNYSLSFDFTWKNLDFSMLFQGSALGSMSYQEPLYAIWGQNGGGCLEQFMDRWHPAGEWTDPYDQSLEWTSGYYALTGHSPRGNSSFNRVSTAFLRLKSIEIGYTIPKFKKAKNFGLRIFANAYNPLTITGVKFVDPEHPDSDLGRLYPLNKTYTLGLNLSF